MRTFQRVRYFGNDSNRLLAVAELCTAWCFLNDDPQVRNSRSVCPTSMLRTHNTFRRLSKSFFVHLAFQEPPCDGVGRGDVQECVVATKVAISLTIKKSKPSIKYKCPVLCPFEIWLVAS